MKNRVVKHTVAWTLSLVLAAASPADILAQEAMTGGFIEEEAGSLPEEEIVTAEDETDSSLQESVETEAVLQTGVEAGAALMDGTETDSSLREASGSEVNLQEGAEAGTDQSETVGGAGDYNLSGEEVTDADISQGDEAGSSDVSVAPDTATGTESDARELPRGYISVPLEAESYTLKTETLAGDDMENLGASYNSLPSKYTNPGLPALRNQGNYNTCWAFTSTGLAELNMIKNGESASSADYSELQLGYFSYHSETDPLGGTDGDVNSSPSGWISSKGGNLQVGGNLVFSSNVLAGWTGSHTDSGALAYTNAGTVNKGSLSSDLAYDDDIHLENYYLTEYDTSDLVSVKNMIYSYGGAGVALYSSNEEKYYNETYNSFYNYEISKSDHALILVGWDDSFSRYNFNETAPGNGAWLARNTWAQSASENESFYGYFWISYYDKGLASDDAYAYTFADADKYEHNYQYDGSMYSGYTGKNKGANVFTVDSSSTVPQVIKAVAFQTLGAEVDYTVRVYTGLTSASNPESGTLRSTVTGSTTYAGHYTIPLSSPVAVGPGERFSVVVSLGGTTMGISKERSYSSNWVTITASAKAGQSFVCSGSTWSDYGKGNNANLRIKAFTSDNDQYYNIIYNANNGSNESFTTTELLGEKVVMAYADAYEKEGYTFAGWSTSSSGSGTVYEAGSEQSPLTSKKMDRINLYAVWSPQKYNVTFNANGGTITGGESSIPVEYGGQYGQVPTATRTGYDFAGWYTTVGNTEQLVTPSTKVDIAADHMVSARWKEKTINVSLDANGGSSSRPGSITVKYNATYSDLTNVTAPTRTGCSFAGWYTDPKVGSRVISTTAVTKEIDHTLYAHWIDDAGEDDASSDVSVSSIALSRTSAVMETGTAMTLLAIVYPSTAAQKLEATASGSAVSVKESPDGASFVITAVQPGSSTVTVKSSNGKKASCKIKVTGQATISVAGKGGATGLAAGKSLTMTATSGGTVISNSALNWSVESSGGVAAISSKGVLTGISEGLVKVSAVNPATGTTGTCSIHVYVPLSKSSISAKSITMASGGTYRLSVKLTPANASLKDGIKWVSSNTSVATVSQTGLVTATGVSGTARITASFTTFTGTSKSCSCTVRVADKSLSKVAVNSSKLSLNIGEAATLTAKCTPVVPSNLEGITWSSSNTSVATVTGGVVRGVGRGTATVTVTAVNDKGRSKTAKCKVTVGAKAEKVTIYKGKTQVTDQIPVAGGKSVKLKAAVSDALGIKSAVQTVQWSSSDINVARVTSAGKVIALRPGEALITATYSGESECSASIPVKVYFPVSKLKLDRTRMNITASSYDVISPIISPVNADCSNVTWTVSGTGVTVLPVSASLVSAGGSTAAKRKLLESAGTYTSPSGQIVSEEGALAFRVTSPGTVKFTATVTDAGGRTKKVTCTVKVR